MKKDITNVNWTNIYVPDGGLALWLNTPEKYRHWCLYSTGGFRFSGPTFIWNKIRKLAERNGFFYKKDPSTERRVIF